jgi:hypothetical protein
MNVDLRVSKHFVGKEAMAPDNVHKIVDLSAFRMPPSGQTCGDTTVAPEKDQDNAMMKINAPRLNAAPECCTAPAEWKSRALQCQH